MTLMKFDSYESAADYFAPEKTNLLFLAEAPPSSVERYFYYPNVKTNDWLWIALMRAIYGEQFKEAKSERGRKMCWLKRFQCDGYRLIDAVKEPFNRGEKPNVRIKRIKSRLDDIVREIQEINPNQIVLIRKTTVYKALYQNLKNRDLPVVNAKLPFPNNGHQQKFQSKFAELVESETISLT